MGRTSIATSDAQEDAGLFELNFNDERYLPFEGAGAISTWSLEMSSVRQFDLDSITDVIMHVRYTAVPGSSERAEIPKECALLLDLKAEFSTAWEHFLEQVPVSGTRVLEFELCKDLVPFYAKQKNNVEVSAKLYIDHGNGYVEAAVGDQVVVNPPSSDFGLASLQVTMTGTDIKGAYLLIALTWT